ncbi:uncharacterized protein Z518_00065 [Rhinocladiella mackenziei CBS 650.93]|uniref:Mitochondrial seryl-tRNA synthetase n=1 Tax=Rhinocladiella mackenziei CBS 650.93 TaxID=1442369 RepID=A0A0D2G365_9EURO|nr:uncharacterized protein Z518_00065 [Rhinocladiella mackenziei CBS 650.93]KIX08987.1 hypothetical protein Z518_00065 [Rhinocladiella mackenziei CBS 650.93]
MRRSIFRAAGVPAKARATRRWLSDSKPEASARSRFDRFMERTPRFLRPTVTGLRNAPVSHMTAFIILHELTAVIPLFGLAGAFHYWRWLPPYFAEGEWISAGVEKFGRYFRKKGWISERDEKEVESMEEPRTSQLKQGMSKWFNRGEDATRWVVEFATAYAMVKVLLPVRIVASVWGSPWCARFAVIPVGNATKAVFRSLLAWVGSRS